MKYVKMLGLAAVAAAALMAFIGASSASATVLCLTEGTGPPTGTTCHEGWALPAGSEIHAVSEEPPRLETSFLTIECEKSTVRGKTTNEGSATETVKGHIEELTFTGNCNCEVKVLAGGSLEVHWIEGTHNGTLKSTGAEVTVECGTIFGKVHCIYKTNGTDIGKITGSSSLKGATATMETEKAEIPRLPTNSLCSEKAIWNAKYSVTTPDFLNVAGHT